MVSALTVTDYYLIALLFLLILINTFVSSSEVAIFSLNSNHIDELKSSSSRSRVRLLETLNNSDKLLASILITYNIINVAIIALLIYLFDVDLNSPASYKSLLLPFAGIAVVLILLIEILPKLYASHNPLKVAQRNIRGVILIDILVSPLSSFLVRFTNVFSQSSAHRKHEISMDDLSKALDLTSSETSYELQDKDMLEGIIRFRDKDVSDILISRADMFAMNYSASFVELIEAIKEAGFSRIPIYEDNEDNIKGVLYVKDLLPHIGESDDYSWNQLIRPAYFTPDNKQIDDLLEEFRANKNHMAIVVDEYGGTAGIVTMEDILEEIVGDISDEYDNEEDSYSIESDGSYIFDGKTPLVDFLRVVDISEKEFDEMLENVDTIAGLILELKGTFPNPKESFKYLEHTFQALDMDQRRILKVRYTPPKN
ncbi:MAG: gliding motility-associated protein GldE [Candidatus Cloacimonetes bacterium]|nr:gliding motility-associated protein GldE [Candidatus Cloacimonadota bacterium]